MMRALFLFYLYTYIFGGVLVVSIFDVSVFMVVSGCAGVLMVAVESLLVLSELPLADFSELQPAAIDPINAATMAKLKNCFFISF